MVQISSTRVIKYRFCGTKTENRMLENLNALFDQEDFRMKIY